MLRLVGNHTCQRAGILLILKIDSQRQPGNRLNASTGNFVGKLQHAEHIGRVGEPNCRKAVRNAELGQFADGQCALEQRIGRVHLEMDELR